MNKEKLAEFIYSYKRGLSIWIEDTALPWNKIGERNRNQWLKMAQALLELFKKCVPERLLAIYPSDLAQFNKGFNQAIAEIKERMGE